MKQLINHQFAVEFTRCLTNATRYGRRHMMSRDTGHNILAKMRSQMGSQTVWYLKSEQFAKTEGIQSDNKQYTSVPVNNDKTHLTEQ